MDVQLLRLRPLHWIGMILLTSNPLQGVVEGSNLFISLQSVRKVYERLRKQKAVQPEESLFERMVEACPSVLQRRHFLTESRHLDSGEARVRLCMHGNIFVWNT